MWLGNGTQQMNNEAEQIRCSKVTFVFLNDYFCRDRKFTSLLISYPLCILKVIKVLIAKRARSTFPLGFLYK